MKKILVIGASGRVGNLMKMAQKKAGNDISLYFHSRQQQKSNERLVDLDHLEDAARHLSSLYGFKFDALLSLAGDTTGVDENRNLTLGVNACSLASKLEIKTVLLMSSSAVYGNYKDIFCEDDECKPETLYGISKIRMEENCLAQFAEKLSLCCLRVGNFYGADSLSNNILLENPITLDVFDDNAGPNRMYIHASVFISLLKSLLDREKYLPNVLNIAQPGVINMKTILSLYGDEYSCAPNRNESVQNILLDLKKLKEVIGDNANLPQFVPTNLRKEGSRCS